MTRILVHDFTKTGQTLTQVIICLILLHHKNPNNLKLRKHEISIKIVNLTSFKNEKKNSQIKTVLFHWFGYPLPQASSAERCYHATFTHLIIC